MGRAWLTEVVEARAEQLTAEGGGAWGRRVRVWAEGSPTELLLPTSSFASSSEGHSQQPTFALCPVWNALPLGLPIASSSHYSASCSKVSFSSRKYSLRNWVLMHR